MTELSCPFCAPATDRVFYSGERVFGMWDAYPVSAGHALLIPRRHIPSWFDASGEEQSELLRALAVARAVIETSHRPDGYNVGINVGAAAGQTVPHLHVHIIPRYAGDVADPRGGVRHVIPGRGNYLVSAREPIAFPDGDSDGPLVTGGEHDPLLPHLIDELDRAEQVAIAAAFTMESGVRLVEEHLRDVLARGGSARIVTGDYLGVTEPAALRRLLDLQGDIQIRIFESQGVSFHPKAYILTARSGRGAAFVGSSNLSETALRRGIEWNYRVGEKGGNLAGVIRAFEELWAHPSTRPLSHEWVDAYALQRAAPAPRLVGAEADPVLPPPEPHRVQREALAALEATRAEGNAAGLVVLATGLGKTWLSAFDSNREEFGRILFIAHREEILTQAMRTFRRVRPQSSLGFYTGSERTPDADVLFASIQTLGRRAHLHRFDARHFDYIVVDEFHHAAAQSYRRVIDYFEPKFLLALTATPERTDGGDLLSLTGHNLVFRCDVADGIQQGLLSPFSYHGVPDDIDYTNIPWRSNRFDEEALTGAAATQARAENALEQYRCLGGARTLGFCVSQRHADFIADFFRQAGLRAVAVHSGPSSAPRAHSLERLAAGELDIVFAVDMFNEGVDLPNVDTVLMLRPTESRIVWLQQFGRGLRHLPGKTLRVIDYIGNHRVFLTKARALFSVGNSDREVSYALDRLDAGSLELPPGCSVTYALEAKEILRSLIQSSANRGERLESYYAEFKDRHGGRPLAAEAFEDGYDPKAARAAGYGSWLGFVRAMGDFTAEQEAVWARHGEFLAQLEVTPMSRSYKMLVLLALLGEDALPGSISIERLTNRFAEVARRYAVARTELGDALDDLAALRRLVIENPVGAWTGGLGTGGVAYFSYTNEQFASTFTTPADQREAFQDLVREIVEWRLAVYVRRAPTSTVDVIRCRVAQSNGRPILFLPDRTRNPGIPEGWTEVIADGETYQARFVQIAVNVVTRPGEDGNVLPDLLRRWFGPNAGQPGQSHDVVFEREGGRYLLRPAGGEAPAGPVRWRRYTREEAVAALGVKLSGWDAQSGIVERPDQILFFVTLDKEGMAEAHQYKDSFLSATEFMWQSQNRNKQNSPLANKLKNHRELGIPIHLFVRRRAKEKNQTQPFLYAGTLSFLRWEREQPITVWWALEEPVPERLWTEVGVPQT